MQIIINADIPQGRINRDIYGHFAEHLGRCIYEGIWVGPAAPLPNTRGIRDDVAAALRQIAIPVLRWPGGCFADEYHWQDGIGPCPNRPEMINVHWGGVTENNHFGTHEFLDFCDQIGAAPYICGNVGSGTVREMRDWIEYLTCAGRSPLADRRRANGRDKPWRIKYFGVGNENWGCGGNMRPEYYADLYRRYACYVRDFSGNRIDKIACGPNNDDYHWTEVLMREAAPYMDGLSLHYYTWLGPSWAEKGAALDFDERAWYETMQKTWFMEELITRHAAIMDQYDPLQRIGLIIDEWGTWHAVEPGTNPGFLYQQNTLRDALAAGINLNIFNNHCNRVRMANLAQTVNVLQALILTEGAQMILTPTYHVFKMYQVHQDAELLAVDVLGAAEDLVIRTGDQTIPRLSVSASRDNQNRIHLSLCNPHPGEGLEVRCELRGGAVSQAAATTLTGQRMDVHNTFEDPEAVKPVAFDDYRLAEDGLQIALPPMSVTVFTLA